MFPLLQRPNFMMNLCFSQRNFSAALPSLVPVKLPSRMETHLWYLLPDEVKSESLLNQYLELLSPCEKADIQTIHGDQLKKRAVLARALVRTTIARYQINSQVNPTSLKFKKNIYGKPEVDWGVDENCYSPPLHFNISHTSSLIACGVTVNVPIGIDVEEKQRRIKHNILAFARRYFSDDEVKLLTDIADPEVQRQEFLKLWTLKEAYVKALGKGFSASPFKTFTIWSKPSLRGCYNLSEASEINVESSDERKWKFALLDLGGFHYGAVCVENENTVAGEEIVPMRVTLRKTLPFVGDDNCVSDTNLSIDGLEAACYKHKGESVYRQNPVCSICFRSYFNTEVLTKENIVEHKRDIRRAILEADVSLQVAKKFIQEVSGQAAGVGFVSGVKPDQQLIVREELVKLLP